MKYAFHYCNVSSMRLSFVGCWVINSMPLMLADSLYACLKANRRVLLNDYPNVTSLHMLNKSVKDKETGQLCLVIGVRKKKERNSLEDPQILPEKIQHGWYRHFVDVFEEELQLLGPQPSDRAPPPMACFNS